MVKIIRGEGPKNSKIVFIAEAPGREEELIGRPFVGRAGKFLTEHLKNIGISRKRVYITNVVKERSIGPPTARQIKRYLPVLKKELKGLHPKIVVLLGNTAYKYAPRILNAIYLKLPHPSAAMRFPKIKKRFLEGLQLLK
jgi:uracil-DNA glycosylase family 4